MISKEQIDRINELYKKKTESGLSDEEAKEQAELRKLYIESYKQNLRAQLENIEFVDSDASKQTENEKAHKSPHKHGKGCGCGCGHDHDHDHSKHKH